MTGVGRGGGVMVWVNLALRLQSAAVAGGE